MKPFGHSETIGNTTTTVYIDNAAKFDVGTIFRIKQNTTVIHSVTKTELMTGKIAISGIQVGTYQLEATLTDNSSTESSELIVGQLELDTNLIPSLTYTRAELAPDIIVKNVQAIDPLLGDRTKLQYLLLVTLLNNSNLPIETLEFEASEVPPRQDGDQTIYEGAYFWIDEYIDSNLDYTAPDFKQAEILPVPSLIKPFFVQSRTKNNGVLLDEVILDTEYAIKASLSGEDFPNWYRTVFTDTLALASKFLTWQPSNKIVQYNQPEYLYFLVNQNILPKGLLLRVKTFKADGTSTISSNIATIDIMPMMVYCIPVGPAILGLDEDVVKYQVWLDEFGGGRISEIKTYQIDTRYQRNIKYIIFNNSLGGFDTLCAKGQSIATLKVTRQEARRPKSSNPDVSFSETVINHTTGERELKIRTGFLTEQEYQYLQELLFAQKIYLVSEKGHIPLSWISNDYVYNQDDVNLRGRELIFRYSNPSYHYSNLPVPTQKAIRPTAWKGTGTPTCLQSTFGLYTGMGHYPYLKKYYTDTNEDVIPYVIKANAEGTEGYIESSPVASCSVENTPYRSAAVSGYLSYTRNNCQNGYVGNRPIHTIPAGTYGSTISQAVADNIAQAQWNLDNSQMLANQIGTCTLVSDSTPNLIARNIPRLTNYSQKPPWSQMRTSLPYHIKNGVAQPKWMVMGQLGHNLFDTNNRPWQNGYASSPDFTHYMTHGLDYIFPVNPDTANDPWPNNIDPATVQFFPPSGKNIEQFVGIAPQYRVVNFLNDFIDYGSVEGFFDAGRSQAYLSHFGHGDYDNGISQALFIAMDKENSTDLSGKQKKAALMIGAAKFSNAFVSEFYTPIFATYSGSLTIDHQRIYADYPVSGTYPQGNRLFGVFDTDFRISIPSRNVVDESVLDYPNIVPCQEIAFYWLDFAKHGSVYDLGEGHFVTVRKFGATFSGVNQPNTFNMLGAFTTFMHQSETFAYYCIYKLGIRGFFQSKIQVDKDDFGGLARYVIADDGQMVDDTNHSRHALNITREWQAIFTLGDYMNGNHKWNWSIGGDNDGIHYNPERNFDGHIGCNAVIKMLNEEGFVDDFDEMMPQLWWSEYSLDGVNWKTTYGVDANMSTTDVLCVRIKIGTGNTANKLELAAFRPEGVEPLEFWARAEVLGIPRIIHVTPNMWQIVDPDYPEGTTSPIPDDKKILHYSRHIF